MKAEYVPDGRVFGWDSEGKWSQKHKLVVACETEDPQSAYCRQVREELIERDARQCDGK